MTAQKREKLIYKGKEYGMASEPFNQYILKNKIDLRLDIINTSLLRGYFGTWEISGNKLFLKEIQGVGVMLNNEKYSAQKLKLREKLKKGLITPQENGKLLKKLEMKCLETIDLSMIKLFNSQEKILADWYTGIIRVPYGGVFLHINSGYNSVYKKELLITIQEGIVTSVEKIQNNNPKSLSKD